MTGKAGYYITSKGVRRARVHYTLRWHRGRSGKVIIK